jgi:hypothetical protein
MVITGDERGVNGKPEMIAAHTVVGGTPLSQMTSLLH